MRAKRTIELSDGTTIDVMAPGPAATMAQLGHLPSVAMFEQGKATSDAERSELSAKHVQSMTAGEVYMMHVRYVCACTRNPMLSADNPAPEGCLYFDDITQEDFDAIGRAVAELKAEAEAAVRPTLASVGETR